MKLKEFDSIKISPILGDSVHPGGFELSLYLGYEQIISDPPTAGYWIKKKIYWVSSSIQFDTMGEIVTFCKEAYNLDLVQIGIIKEEDLYY